MKRLNNMFIILLTLLMITSCSDDDGNNTTPIEAANHTYAIEVTSGFLDGTSLSGTVPNENFIGLYVEDAQENLIFLSQGLQGDSGFIIGGGVAIQNGQAFPLTNTVNGFEGSSLLVGFDINNVTYTFESLSGTCAITNLNQSPAANGSGIASYILNFSGTFRQANTGGPDDEAPVVQMSGTIDIKRAL